MKMPSLLMRAKNNIKLLLMNKAAVVTLLIRSFRGGQETIAHYLYALSYI